MITDLIHAVRCHEVDQVTQAFKLVVEVGGTDSEASNEVVSPDLFQLRGEYVFLPTR